MLDAFLAFVSALRGPVSFRVVHTSVQSYAVAEVKPGTSHDRALSSVYAAANRIGTYAAYEVADLIAARFDVAAGTVRKRMLAAVEEAYQSVL
jgi:hypothetical protein